MLGRTQIDVALLPAAAAGWQLSSTCFRPLRTGCTRAGGPPVHRHTCAQSMLYMVDRPGADLSGRARHVHLRIRSVARIHTAAPTTATAFLTVAVSFKLYWRPAPCCCSFLARLFGIRRTGCGSWQCVFATPVADCREQPEDGAACGSAGAPRLADSSSTTPTCCTPIVRRTTSSCCRRTTTHVPPVC